MTTLDLATLRLRLTADNREFKKGVQGGRDSARQFGADLKTLVGGAATAAFAAATAAAIEFGKQSIQEFKQFDKQTREVFTLLPGLSEQAMGEMRGDVLDFSRETGRLTDEVVPALYQSISAGVPPENVFDFMRVASDAALGGVTELETAVDGISSVVNAYGREAISAQEASDLMFTAVRGGKTTFDELSSSLFNVIPTASALEVEFGNITAALATLTAQGTPTSVATTQLRQLLVELSKDGSKASDVFAEMAGQSFQEFIRAGGNLQEALILMEQAAANNNVALQDMFGSVEAGSAALGLTGASSEKFAGELAAAEDAAGATTEAAALMADSMEQLEGRVDASTEALQIQAGEALAPLRQEYLETRLEINKLFSDSLSQRDQINETAEALRGMGIEGAALRQTINALFEGNTLWRESMVDAETMALRTDTVLGILENGFSGTTEELAAAAIAQAEFGASSRRTAAELDAVADETETAAATTENYEAALAAAESQLGLMTAAQLAAAEAAEAEAAALREAQSELGGYFNDALLADEQTDSLERQLYDAAAAAGVGAAELVVLAAATGDFTEAEIEAAFQAALMTANIDGLVEAMQEGRLTAEQATDAVSLLADGTADTAAAAIEMAGGVSEAAAAARDLAGAADASRDALNGIPKEVVVDIIYNLPPAPVVPTGASAAQGNGPFMSGGYTGDMAANQIAGYVHGQEYVFSAPAVRSIGLPALERMHESGKRGGGMANAGEQLIDRSVTNIYTMDRSDEVVAQMARRRRERQLTGRL